MAVNLLSLPRVARAALALGASLAAALTAASPALAQPYPGAEWAVASPESQGLARAGVEAAAAYAQEHGGASGCIVRHGVLVAEWGDPAARADIKSATKGSIGTTLLGLAVDAGLVGLDDPGRRHYPKLGEEKSGNQATGRLDRITVRHLATMTAGFDDGRPPLLAYDPGTKGLYSNDTSNMLAELLTLRFGEDLRAVLKRRVLDPIGVRDEEWVWRDNSYRARAVNDIPSREFASGITITHRALARIGYLYLREGEWDGRRILSREFIREATRPTELPSFVPYYAFYWGSNGRGTYAGMPRDAYWALGLGDSFVLVCPGLDVVAVRLGVGSTKSQLPGGAPARDPAGPEDWGQRVEGFFVLVARAVLDPCPRSPVIRHVAWAPPDTIVRRAKGSDNWPLAWGDDGHLYTAYGDGSGFEPFTAEKLSLGFARIEGGPADFRGVNIRSPSGEATGDGPAGKKASGLLAVDGVLYLWARNAGNSQLAWSSDHGASWTWADWKFTESFGCPTSLHFGRDHAGARDGYLYIYSPDADGAYQPADRMVLARVSRESLRDRAAYEFLERVDEGGRPVWTRDLARRGTVFSHPGRCWRGGVTYSPSLKRYLWCQVLPGAGQPPDPRFQGGFGIYDAPEPWGPWTTAFFTADWDAGPGESSSLPPKWMSADGKTVHLVFSGDDSFAVRRGDLVLADAAPRDAAPASPAPPPPPAGGERLRVIVETDAGGDPDDEQSMVRFLLYAGEWDVEGIIVNRDKARDRENLNRERTGLGIVLRQIQAYEECYPRLVQHDPRYPKPEVLRRRTVPGHDEREDGVQLVLAALDAPDPRPLWFLNWGTDNGSGASCLKRALDRIRKERGPEGYAAAKKKLRVICHGDVFGEHTTGDPPFPLLVDTFRPEVDRKRWYHRFSALTATAGGFDIERDLLTGHGPLGALYPTNTTHPQKEGDTMTFLYLVPTGMNDPEHPEWGSWAGRYGLNPELPGRRYHWANQVDAWEGTTHRDNVLKRWAAHLQNDFKARLDWCVSDLAAANHPPVPRVRGEERRMVAAGDAVLLEAAESSDPDRNGLRFEWIVYAEAGGYDGPAIAIEGASSPRARFTAPRVEKAQAIHLILAVSDDGAPPLTRYRRVIVTVAPGSG